MVALKIKPVSKEKILRPTRRLILGTASFGMSYGVTNERGEVPYDEIKNILELCRTSGIEEIDTAQVYGCAESNLGKAGVSGLRLNTKIYLEPDDNANSIRKKVLQSLERLKIPRIQNLLVHNEEILRQTNADSAIKELRRHVACGLAAEVGLSSYEPHTALELCKKFGFRVVQLPANVLDNRLFEDGLFQRFVSEGVEVQIRSVFFQGVLLQDPPDKSLIPTELLKRATAFRAQCAREGVSPLQAALGHVLTLKEEARIVIGVSKISELRTILKEINKAKKLKEYSAPVWKYDLDPRNWPLS